ncbi:hypothetical protein EDB89DRAFT_1905145 [Lactarius sanguifluus]|nr:hypothetical protein EDB89DRAFT_1905145 [Lactarius sanguifluus]
MNSDVAGRGGDGVGGAEAASAAAASTGGLFAGPKGWRWRWLWWWQCRGGSDEGCGCGGNGDDWYTDEREWERRNRRPRGRRQGLVAAVAVTGVTCTRTRGGGGNSDVSSRLKGERKKKPYLRGAGGATGVGGGGSGCDGNGGDLYMHKGKRGDVDVSSKLKRSWRAPRDGVEATVGATGLVHMGWSRGGSDEGWCHRQRDITRGFEVKGKKKTYQHGTRQNDSRRVACSVGDETSRKCKVEKMWRQTREGPRSQNNSVGEVLPMLDRKPPETRDLLYNGRNTTRMSTATVVTATSPHAHTGHIPLLLPPTPVAATAASTPRQFPVHPPSPDVNVAPASPRARKATPSLQPPLPSPVPVGAPSTPQLPHRFLTRGQDAADDALGRCPVHQDTMLSFPHRSLQHRAGKTPPSLIRRDDTMARDDMSRCDNLTTCKNRTGYEHRPPRRAKPRIDVRRAGGHDINTAPQPYGTAVRLRHRLGPATLQRQWDVARTRHLPRRLRHQQHNGIVARPRHRRSLQALPRRYGANTAARKPRRVPTTPTAARQAGVR